MPRNLPAWLLLWGGMAVPSAHPLPSAPLLGVITQIEGTVEAAGPGTGEPPLARPWQVIQSRVVVRVPKGGAVGVVCSNRRFITLRGPAKWMLSAAGCSRGRELTVGEYKLLVPQAGRFRVLDGLLVAKREFRVDPLANPLAPLVLSPRNAALRSLHPRISWIPVAGATEYLVRWTGGGSPQPERILNAGEVECTAGRPKPVICSVAWPAGQANLPRGGSYTLLLGARSGLSDPWRFNPAVELTTPFLADAASVDREVEALAGLGLHGAALEVAVAGVLARRGYLSEAAEHFQEAWAKTRIPELRITIADLHLATGLSPLAEALYREALQEERSDLRAAAAFGLGRVAMRRAEPVEAAGWFRKAMELYSPADLEEREAARKAAEDAASRPASPSPALAEPAEDPPAAQTPNPAPSSRKGPGSAGRQRG